ncbi:hypothetical protein EON78_06450 [bacterium]|nr:MAG: hypothetical protein EON78_06450 [bacterium]
MNKLAISILLFSMTTACQVKTAKVYDNENPIPVPSSSASPAPEFYTNVKLLPGCNGSVIACPDGATCNSPACTEEVAAVKIAEPKVIAESSYEAIKTKFSLFNVNPSTNNLGALTPSYPIAEGLKAQCNENEGLIFNGGKLASCTSLIVEKSPNNFEQITNLQALKSTFAPIDSEAEVISYLTAATNTEAKFTFDLQENFRYYQLKLTPTAVTKHGADYMVNMFAYQRFGCGPHPNFEVVYHVTKSGDIEEVSRTKIYEDPARDGLCVD